MDIEKSSGLQASVLGLNRKISSQNDDWSAQFVTFRNMLDQARLIPYEEISSYVEESSNSLRKLQQSQLSCEALSPKDVRTIMKNELEVGAAAIFYAPWPIPQALSAEERAESYEFSLHFDDRAQSFKVAQQALRERAREASRWGAAVLPRKHKPIIVH